MAPALHFRTTLGLGSLFQHRRVLQHADDAGHVLMAAGRRRCVGGERRLKPGASSDRLSVSARQDCRAWSTRGFACTPDHRRTAGCVLHLLLGYRTPLLKEESSNQVLKLIKACRIVPHHHINSSRFSRSIFSVNLNENPILCLAGRSGQSGWRKRFPHSRCRVIIPARWFYEGYQRSRQ